jgi:hypothetical protein
MRGLRSGRRPLHVCLIDRPGSPVFLRFDDIGSGTLTIRLVVYGYSAFTAGRQPTATCKVIGTGLAAPTF